MICPPSAMGSDEAVHLPCRPRCARCQDVIGVYEPMIVCGLDGRAYVTSLAAEPAAAETLGRRYHSACFELIAAHPRASA